MKPEEDLGQDGWEQDPEEHSSDESGHPGVEPARLTISLTLAKSVTSGQSLTFPAPQRQNHTNSLQRATLTLTHTSPQGVGLHLYN